MNFWSGANGLPFNSKGGGQTIRMFLPIVRIWTGEGRHEILAEHRARPLSVTSNAEHGGSDQHHDQKQKQGAKPISAFVIRASSFRHSHLDWRSWLHIQRALTRLLAG